MFYKGQKPRQFTYKPWFYNAEQEEFESRIKAAKKRYHNEGDDDFTPSESFNFKSGNQSNSIHRTTRFQSSYGKVNPWRLLSLIAILGGLMYYIFFYS